MSSASPCESFDEPKLPIYKRFINWCRGDGRRRKFMPCIKRDPYLHYGRLPEPPCKWKPSCKECIPSCNKYRCVCEYLPSTLQRLESREDRLRAVKWLTYPADPCRLRSGYCEDLQSNVNAEEAQSSFQDVNLKPVPKPRTIFSSSSDIRQSTRLETSDSSES